MKASRTMDCPLRTLTVALTAVFGLAAAASASGPQFQASSSGDSTHTADLGGGVAGSLTKTYPGDEAYVNSSNPPVIAGFSAFPDGAGGTTAVGGLGHQTFEQSFGYAVSSFPGTVGVSQMDGGGFASMSELEQNYNNVWGITGSGWYGPQLAYAVFVLGVNLAAGDTASFTADFTHRVDFAGDGWSAGQGDVEKNLAMTTGTIIGPDVTPRILFDSTFLTFSNIAAGAIYTVDGTMTVTAENQTGPAGIDLLELESGDPAPFQAIRLDPITGAQIEIVTFDLPGFADFIPGLPNGLSRTHGGGSFGAPVPIPEPATVALLAMGGAMLVSRRRR